MTREELLEKSRKENGKRDPFEKEVIAKGNTVACIAAAVLATAFFILQIAPGRGTNYALYAVVMTVPAAGFRVKYVHLKRKHEPAAAIGHTVLVIMLTVAQICVLTGASAAA